MRVMRTQIVAAGLVLALSAVGHADTTAENVAKYWNLRTRLDADFVRVGPEQGRSQPSNERFENLQRMKWGDSTIALGFYIGTLATEHYMLAHPTWFPGADGSRPNQLAATRDQLYYALLALDRLDELADAAFPDPCSTTPAKNGFFLRDDIPADYAAEFPGISSVESDFLADTLTNKEESQDQVYHLQHGLALVIALVPDTVVVQGTSLRAWAVEQATRIVQHFAKGDWIIRNPACNNRAVNRGENAIGYSYGETLAAAYLSDGAFTPTTSGLWTSVWNTLKSPTNPAYDDADNLHMSLAIMAVGDGYGMETAQVMTTLAATQEWPLYPLMHRVLHPDNDGFCAAPHTTVNPLARRMIDELPASPDPSCPGTSPAVHGFTSHNRFIRGKDQAYVGPPECVDQPASHIRYHGLDAMLLHNLYAIATPLTWNTASDDADPCGALPEEPSPDGPDAGVGSGDPDPDGEDEMTPGGCACSSSTPRDMPWALVLAFVLRRRRRGAVTSKGSPLATASA